MLQRNTKLKKPTNNSVSSYHKPFPQTDQSPREFFRWILRHLVVIMDKIVVQVITCCSVRCWSTWCLDEGNSFCDSNPDPPLTVSWKTWYGPLRNVPSQILAAPLGHGPCTQTQGKRHLDNKHRNSWKQKERHKKEEEWKEIKLLKDLCCA